MRIFVLIICLLTALAGQAQTNGFVLKGKISGVKEGQWVYLTDMDQQVVYDSIVIKNGIFEFQGIVKLPELRCLTIYKNLQNQEAWNGIIALPIFVENTLVTVEAPYEKMPTKGDSQLSTEVKVKGGPIHEQYALYMKGYLELYQQYCDLYSRYGTAYYYHKGTEEEIFRMVKEIDKIRENIFRYQADFIHRYPQSPVVRYVVENMAVERYGRKEAERLVSYFPEEMRDTEEGQALEKNLLNKTLYLNDPLPDVRMLDLEGQLVPLVDLVEKGRYTLVEFWASWCGPCRSDIPHLKETYEKYHPQGFDIISVSIDDSSESWKKAVKEEKMLWKQLRDTGGKQFDKNGIRAFGVMGVPSGFLIDPSGKVIQLKSRGGWLDMKLFELLNK